MDPTDIGLFRLAERRLAWVDRRQQVLAQNIANANTPGYTARDLHPFERALPGASPGASPGAAPSMAAGGAPALARTSLLHLAAAGDAAGGGGATARPRPHERAPDGNAVSVEDELTKVADTAGAHDLTAGLYRKYMGMFRTALGRAG